MSNVQFFNLSIFINASRAYYRKLSKMSREREMNASLSEMQNAEYSISPRLTQNITAITMDAPGVIHFTKCVHINIASDEHEDIGFH